MVVLVVWLSRHAPLKIQTDTLQEILGNYIFHRLEQRIPNVEYIIQYIEKLITELHIEPERVVIIPVLPLSMTARLVELARKKGWEVWWAEMEMIKQLDYPPEPEKDYDPVKETVVVASGAHERTTYKIMRFKQFHKIKDIRLELEPIN